MKELDALKMNWQNQKSAADLKFDTGKMTAASLSKLKKFEKRILRINLIKTAGIVIAMALLIWVLLFASPASAFNVTAVSLLVISVIVFWTKYLKLQLSTARLNVKENSLDFIDDVLKNFSAQREFFRKDFKVFGAVLIVFINVLYLDLLNGMPLLERIGFHVVMTAVLLAVLFFGVKFRMRRFKNENEPIENELLKMKEDLKENAVS